jgi:membrane protease YdiL (CAAX protease family)
MTKENKKIKFCVYCGTNVAEDKIYCPKCGKLIIKLEPSKITPKPKRIPTFEITRKCPGCNSVITSTVLDQCPICNTALEKLSEVKKETVQRKPGLIFTSKKLEPETKFILKKDTWNLKEGINVFGTCVYVLIISFFALFAFISFQLGGAALDINIQLILLNQIPEILFGVYPIWYIYKRKHSFNKLGFYSDSKKILIAILIGILGFLAMLLINYFSDPLINFFSDVGLDFFDVKSSIVEQNQIIRDADILWIILLAISLCVRAVSLEIVFRGVLHNALKQKFKNEFYVILIVALIYSLVMLVLSFSIGMSFFIINFLMFVVLRFLYSINGNLYNTIIAHIYYSILIIILVIS